MKTYVLNGFNVSDGDRLRLANWLKHYQICSVWVYFYPNHFQRCLCILCILSKKCSLDFAVIAEWTHLTSCVFFFEYVCCQAVCMLSKHLKYTL